jgi:hypothetical protein
MGDTGIAIDGNVELGDLNNGDLGDLHNTNAAAVAAEINVYVLSDVYFTVSSLLLDINFMTLHIITL